VESTTTTTINATTLQSTLLRVANAPSAGCGCSSGSEVDAGSCAATTGSFPRFFAGQLVQPDDLTAIEQRIFFHEQLRARHLIGWGVSCGYRVAFDGTAAQQGQRGEPLSYQGGAAAGYEANTVTLRVESGYALDRYGRDVYMPANYSVALQKLLDERTARIQKAMGDPWCVVPGCQPTPATTFCLAVRYKECPDKPVPSYAQQCGTPKTLCEYSRITECVEFRVFGDDELAALPVTKSASNISWCSIPARSRELVLLFAEALSFPDRTCSSLSGVVRTQDTTQSGTTTNYASLTRALDPEAEYKTDDSATCDDLLHLPRACDPCVDSPWIPLACFTLEQGVVSAPDCSVRRILYSLQEVETLSVRLFCALLEIAEALKGAQAAQQEANQAAPATATPQQQSQPK
jgi:hypothetical protein